MNRSLDHDKEANNKTAIRQRFPVGTENNRNQARSLSIILALPCFVQLIVLKNETKLNYKRMHPGNVILIDHNLQSAPHTQLK